MHLALSRNGENTFKMCTFQLQTKSDALCTDGSHIQMSQKILIHIILTGVFLRIYPLLKI